MILKNEVQRIAEQQGLSKSTIDKDWALGHLLNGIYQNDDCKKHWVFKGGTCLSKCYFPNYRFSEDLDFTVVDVPESYEFTYKNLNEILQQTAESSGIRFSISQHTTLLSKNQHVGYKSVVKFWGADHSKNQIPPPAERWQTSIKIELIQFEEMVFGVQNKSMFHPYSDKDLINAIIPCYHLHEVLAEKLRALIQRSYTAPRDFYDIWYLSTTNQIVDWHAVKDAFFAKMEFKGLRFNGIDEMIRIENIKRFEADWNNSLGHHLPADTLPNAKLVVQHIENLLKELFE